MSIDQLDTKHLTQIAVIGDGCAALSLASKADLLPKYQLHVIAPKMHLSEQDHIWGLWQMDWLQDVVPLARKTWHKWAIINHNTKVVMQANEHPYQAVTRRSWLAHCKRKAQQNKVSFHETIADIGTLPLRQILDSRPPKQKSGMMLQHFIGWEVRADPGSFDDKIAILMDFRCDQSRGMHFIYFLPFSNSDALVESTLFSCGVEPDDFYETAISNWLKNCAGISRFELIRREKSAIPLGLMESHDPTLQGIGANGGAIRPSSGYAFSFIQKQIKTALTLVSDDDLIKFSIPHKKIDLWMDRIFLHVLRNHPHYAPQIFTSIAARLTGDEFALFMSGEANNSLRKKVVWAMPFWPFFRALLSSKPSEL